MDNSNHFRYVTPLADRDVPEKYQKTLMQWRSLAAAHNYSGPVAWSVKSGFECPAPRSVSTPVWMDCLGVRWLKNDYPTRNSIVFWIPRMLNGTLEKSVVHQRLRMAEIRASFELPEHHLRDFGGASLILALMIAHHGLSHEQVPQENLVIRSDTFTLGGPRLSLSFLRYYFGDDGAYNDVGVFPIGIELP